MANCGQWGSNALAAGLGNSPIPLDAEGQRAYNNGLFERRLFYALSAQTPQEKDSEAQTQEEDAGEPPQEEESLIYFGHSS